MSRTTIRPIAVVLPILALAAIALFIASRDPREYSEASAARSSSERTAPDGSRETPGRPPLKPSADESRPEAAPPRESRIRTFIAAQEAMKASAPRPPESTVPREVIERWQARVVEDNRPPADRVKGLLLLQAKAPRDFTPEVRAAAIRLFQVCEDEGLRENLCRSLRGQDSGEIKFALMERLRTDPSARVREAAAGSLGPLRKDSTIHAALQQSVEADAATSVRNAARQALLD